MPNLNITIIDIAKQLNISPSTVSRALRNHPDINPDTKSKILSVADELRYNPNRLAQSLKSKITKTIGIIVPEIKHEFFSSVISGIEHMGYSSGYSILLTQSNEDYQREIMNTKTLLSHRVDGILVSVSENTVDVDHFKSVMKNKVPLVFFDRVSADLQCATVECDDYHGAFTAVEHLIQRGYKRIAHVAGYEHTSIGKSRLRGYRDALSKHGIPFDPQWVRYGGLNEEDGIKAFESLFGEGKIPDAFFAVNDPVAVGLFMKIKEKGLKIPDDIALVGFSDNSISSLLDPPLTTVRQPAYKMGEMASRVLIDQLESTIEFENTKHLLLETELIIRKST